MTTPQTPRENDLVAAKFEAEVREADARLKVLQAQAEAGKAKADMDEISGLAAAKERVKKNIADLKQQAAADYAATKREVEKEIKDLQADIERVNERFTAWDSRASGSSMRGSTRQTRGSRSGRRRPTRNARTRR